MRQLVSVHSMNKVTKAWLPPLNHSGAQALQFEFARRAVERFRED